MPGLVGITLFLFLLAPSVGLAAPPNPAGKNIEWVDRCDAKVGVFQIILHDDEKINIEQEEFNGNELGHFLNSRPANIDRRRKVFICADRNVKYSVFMDVINQLNVNGFHNIGLIAVATASLRSDPLAAPISPDTQPIATPK